MSAAVRTFTRRHRALSAVYGDDAALKASVDKFHGAHGLPIDELEAGWREMRGVDPGKRAAGAAETIAQAIRWTMPTGEAPLLAVDEVAAAYAMGCICEALVTTATLGDLAVRRAVEAAWRKFEQRRILANAVEEGFGCDESAAWHTLRETADYPEVEAKMRAIADLAGSMHRAMSAVAHRVPTDDPHGVTGIERGGDPDRLLPSEIAKLADPELGDRQAMAILDRQAHQRQFRGERRMARGPLVLAIDESGSMHDADKRFRGRNTWAKACAVALTRIAHAEGRHVRCVHWSSAVVLQDVPVGDSRAVWEMAHSFLSGGTSMDMALRAAHRAALDLRAEGVTGADVVLISDGEDHVGDEQIQAMTKDGVELWSVAIGAEWAQDFPPRALARLYISAHDRDLSGKRGAELAEGLSAAAKAREEMN